MNVERLKLKDYDDFMDFSNMIFSQTFCSFHFQEDIPIAFGRSDERMHYQYAVRENGRIRAAAGIIPYKLAIDDEILNVRHITNVGTHYNSWGKGYMQNILKTAISDMDKEDVDFTLLCGHRERYRFLGFELAGTETIALFRYYNALNRRKKGELEDFTFKVMPKDDKDALKDVLAFYNKAPIRYIRPESVAIEHMSIYGTQTYLIYDSNNILSGYLLFNKGWSISEMSLSDTSTLPRVINSFMKQMNLEEVYLHISPMDFGLQEMAYEAAEEIQTEALSMFNIRKPERLLAALLNCKQNHGGALPQGNLVLGTIWGNLLITNDGHFTVQLTDQKADAVFDGHQIYSLLFGPAPSSVFRFSDVPEIFRSWFPLPLYINRVDHY